MKPQSRKLPVLAFSGYINNQPYMIFHTDDKSVMWIEPTEYAFEYLKLLAEGFRRN